MKKIILAALLAVSLPAAADPYNGAYSCIVNSGTTNLSFYAAIITKPTGEALWTALSAAKNTAVYGFAVGKISGTKFSGTDNTGSPFSIDLGDGSVLSFDDTFNNTPAHYTCLKIW